MLQVSVHQEDESRSTGSSRCAVEPSPALIRCSDRRRADMRELMEPEPRFGELFASTYQRLAAYGRRRGVAGQYLEDLLSATYEVAWRRSEEPV
jgi:hypothetical protein